MDLARRFSGDVDQVGNTILHSHPAHRAQLFRYIALDHRAQRYLNHGLDAQAPATGASFLFVFLISGRRVTSSTQRIPMLTTENDAPLAPHKPHQIPETTSLRDSHHAQFSHHKWAIPKWQINDLQKSPLLGFSQAYV
jgi:hypothetical protein